VTHLYLTCYSLEENCHRYCNLDSHPGAQMAEGYNLYDPKYLSWLKISHPEATLQPGFSFLLVQIVVETFSPPLL